MKIRLYLCLISLVLFWRHHRPLSRNAQTKDFARPTSHPVRGWTGKNKAFCSPGTQNGRRVIKVYSWRCSSWRCSEGNCKHGREHKGAVEFAGLSWLKAPLERDHCCQWLVKWSAALVRLPTRNRQARWQMRGLWYSLFHTSGYTRTFQLLYRTVLRALWLVKFFSGHKSFSGEFYFMFFMIAFMVFFPIWVFLYQMLETVLSMTVGSLRKQLRQRQRQRQRR